MAFQYSNENHNILVSIVLDDGRVLDEVVGGR
jgi:hypothetical protein